MVICGSYIVSLDKDRRTVEVSTSVDLAIDDITRSIELRGNRDLNRYMRNSGFNSDVFRLCALQRHDQLSTWCTRVGHYAEWFLHDRTKTLISNQSQSHNKQTEQV